jgi:hypothetical protein
MPYESVSSSVLLRWPSIAGGTESNPSKKQRYFCTSSSRHASCRPWPAGLQRFCPNRVHFSAPRAPHGVLEVITCNLFGATLVRSCRAVSEKGIEVTCHCCNLHKISVTDQIMRPALSDSFPPPWCRLPLPIPY